VCSLPDAIDHEGFAVSAEGLDDIQQQLVGEWSEGCGVKESPVDGLCFNGADHDGKRAAAVDFGEMDPVLVVEIARNDTGQFHTNGHRELRVYVEGERGMSIPR
jgi:hypothetical protein